MSLVTNLQTAFTRVGTEFKAIRVLISGSGTGGIGGLNTTNKTSLVSAINELYARPVNGGALSALSDVTITTAATGNVIRYDGTKWVNVVAETYYQPRDTDLDAIAALTTTTYGRALLGLANQAALMALMSASSETAAGDIQIATQTIVNAGTNDLQAVTPLKLASRLASYQPLDSDLTAIAALTTTTYGRALLTQADAASTRSTLGLATVASSGLASDLTGTLPTSVLPPLAINEVFTVATQAAMLALTAQRGDMAVRTDNGKTYVLSTDSPATLADWKEILAAGQVQSVNGQSGVVVLSKSDVGLSNVTNVAQQPLDSTLTALAGLTTAVDQMIYSTGADTFAMTTLTAFGRTLIDDVDAATARGTLGVYSTTDIGDPNTDFNATFVAALA